MKPWLEMMFWFSLGALILVVASLSRVAHADDLVTVGFGPSLNEKTNPKMLALGYEKTWAELSLYSHCGAIFQETLNGFCAVTIGVHIETPAGIFSRATVGPAYYLRTYDPRISTNWNVNLIFAVGVYQGPAFFDAEYIHGSNGGAAGANLGDDHALAQLGYRF